MKSDLAHPGACLCVEERKEEASKLCISEHDASLMKQFDKLHSVFRTYTINEILLVVYAYALVHIFLIKEPVQYTQLKKSI